MLVFLCRPWKSTAMLGKSLFTERGYIFSCFYQLLIRLNIFHAILQEFLKFQSQLWNKGKIWQKFLFYIYEWLLHLRTQLEPLLQECQLSLLTKDSFSTAKGLNFIKLWTTKTLCFRVDRFTTNPSFHTVSSVHGKFTKFTIYQCSPLNMKAVLYIQQTHVIN